MATGVEEPRNNTTTTTITIGVSRLGQWFALGFFASIALIALVTRFDDISGQRAVDKWVLSVLCIAIGLAGLAIMASLAVPDKFSGTKAEGGMSLLALCFLSAGLPAIMNVGNRLAVKSDGSIRDGNLYFFSWFSLLAALILFMSYMSASRGLGLGGLFSWPVLCLTSLVVMAAALDLMESRDVDNDETGITSVWGGCKDNDSHFCKRSRFAAIWGAICGVFSLLWTFVGSKLPGMVDSVARLLVVVPWAAAVAVLTFGGSKAPGREVGSLYFFTWASFFIAGFMALAAVTGLMSSRGGDSEPKPSSRRDVESS